MLVGLIDIEPKIFNTAYMQIAAFERQRGNGVRWWSPLTDHQFDKLYCSSIFNYTDKSQVPERAFCGGTGFDVRSRLPREVEACQLDYSIYPKCETSYLWFSRLSRKRLVMGGVRIDSCGSFLNLAAFRSYRGRQKSDFFTKKLVAFTLEIGD